MAAMTPFLDVLRAAFPPPQGRGPKPTQVGGSPSKPRKRPAPPPAKKTPGAGPPAFPGRPRWVEEVTSAFDYAAPDPSASTYSPNEKELLRVLCVDHLDLREADERAETRRRLNAVMTSKGKKGKTGGDRSTPLPTTAQELLRHCALYVEATSSTVFSPLELAETILQTTDDAAGQDDLLQSHLFGLVGVEGMELISFVLQHQEECGRGGTVTRQALADAARATVTHAPGGAGGGSMRPAVASSFSIQTASELEQTRQQRKAQRRAARQGHTGDSQDDEDAELAWLEAAGYDLEVVRLQRQLEAEDRRDESTSLLMREFGRLDGGFDTSGAAGQLTSAGMISLPASTKRTYYKGYEHVFIPAHAKKSLGRGEQLVPISSLEAFAQTAFKGMSHLNRLQSKLFDAAYNTNQNLLVCAPTGAGKTNVAMLTILQEVKSQLQRRGGLAQMKIIYVAPMKALAQEVVTKFGERLRDLKLQVAELTGDMQLTKKEIEQTHVIVTTPEKWDVITRKSSTQQALLSQVKLLIIDEVHLLADERGPVIETIVARTLRRVESTQSMIRIVGLSATLPNYVDVATFLRVYVPPGDAKAQNAATNGGRGGLFFFDSTYRPVPLDQTFIGVSTNASLKDAIGLPTSELTSTLETQERKTNNSGAVMSKQKQIQLMLNKLALAHCLKQVRNKEQVMVFVHSRKETAATMRAIIELAQGDEEEPGTIEAFLPPSELVSMPTSLLERIQKSRNKELKDLVSYGLGIHHAGMLRSDRNLTEELFEKGYIRVLCCTATLAWGVNLPAHSVLIKGTQVYNADKGGITQLSMLDVMQIFGRAGRPQYDDSGDAVLMTTHDQLSHYLRLLTSGIPMESALIKALPDHLNAEVVSGTVSNLDEACEWLSYTYLFVRMRKNPLAYGLKYEDIHADPTLLAKRKELLIAAAEKLQSCRMIKILREKVRLDSDVATEEGKISFAVTAMGRVASHFYIQHTSIQTFNELLDSKPGQHRSRNGMSTDEDNDDNDLEWERVLLVLCSSNEFEQLKAREDEMNELERLKKNFCRFEVRGGGIDTYVGKTNVLLQALIGKARVSSFTLISDTNYVAQNASRVCRALFEICLKKNSARQAEKFLQLSNSIDQKLWWDQSPLLQLPNVPLDVVGLADQQHLDAYEVLADPGSYSISGKLRKWITMLPFVDIDEVVTQPCGGNMLRVSYALYPLFPEWRENAFAGRTLSYWVWVEDGITGFIYHSEYVVLHQSRFLSWKEGSQRLDMECYVPVFASGDGQNANYVIRVISDRFVGIETFYEVSFTPSNEGSEVTAPTNPANMYTKLLTLHPQPLQSLENRVYEAIYSSRFQSFNPIQTQSFHQLYHEDGNALICAPTGSGKTVCAELAMLRVWKLGHQSRSLIVYIAPLKALAREKVAEWKLRFESNKDLRKKVVEVTGETLVNVEYLLTRADIVVTTPEKWDLLTRSPIFGHRLMARTALVILDEVHLVGDAPRGAVLEVLVSRLRRSTAHLKHDAGSMVHCDDELAIRLIGLSTALANAHDVGSWLGITKDNNGQVYNFRASVRPVPMQVHIQGFPERHYVSRMAAMNKPTFMAIRTHSPEKPTLIFVSSKAQTKLTALDLISFCVSQSDSTGTNKPFLRVDDSVMDSILRSHHIVDDNLKHTLSFGIGLHHAGLARKDRELVEKLFRDKMIQVIISTSTLAWGVNLPAHLVVIKGTEYFQNGRYRSYPISDLLQMIGRAGRPLLDDKGVACVLVEEAKKNMIQRLLYEPLTIESCLGERLENHLNAEIAGGLVRTKSDIIQYLSWSLLFQRVVKNPTYYGYGQQGTSKAEPSTIGSFFQGLVDSTLKSLTSMQCCTLDESTGKVTPTFLGKVASSLYLDIRSICRLQGGFQAVIADAKKNPPVTDDHWLLKVLCVICESSLEVQDASPLRHHEVQSGLIADLCDQVKYSPMTHLFSRAAKKQRTMLETHGSEFKAFLLIQMHMQRVRIPSSDMLNDVRSLLDQFPRLLGAAIDICAALHHLDLVVAAIRLSQGLFQGMWCSTSAEAFTQLPFVNDDFAKKLRLTVGTSSFSELKSFLSDPKKKKLLQKQLNGAGNKTLTEAQLNEVARVVDGIPRFTTKCSMSRACEGDNVVLTVELSAEDGQNTTVLASLTKQRVQKPKPYAFYVLLYLSGSSALLQLKRIAWKPHSVVTFVLPNGSVPRGSEVAIKVCCDAIAGLDVEHTIRV